MKDPLEKATFLEIDCDEIPVPFAVLQGYSCLKQNRSDHSYRDTLLSAFILS